MAIFLDGKITRIDQSESDTEIIIEYRRPSNPDTRIEDIRYASIRLLLENGTSIKNAHVGEPVRLAFDSNDDDRASDSFEVKRVR